MSATDGDEIVALFGQWFEKEGLAGTVTAAECELLARAFMAGYAQGLYGNAERTGDDLADLAAATLRRKVATLHSAGGPQ